MIIEILIAVAAILVVLAIVIASRPAKFRISRSATIPAPASVIFAEVNDFRRWQAWSPWARLDPRAQNTFEGTESGVGSIFHWKGNNQVGEGGMTIIESQPNELVRIRLEFLKPFQATNLAEFTFETKADGTLVTWSMTGTNNFVAKAVVMIMNCDKMVGGMFEKGLANLNDVTLALAATACRWRANLRLR